MFHEPYFLRKALMSPAVFYPDLSGAGGSPDALIGAGGGWIDFKNMRPKHNEHKRERF